MKSEGVSFNQAEKELKDNFEIVDNYTTEENVDSLFEYEIIPKKIESQLSKFIVYDLETYNTDRAKPYSMTFYRLSKKSGRYEQDPTQEGLEKSLKDTLAFAGDKCISNALDYCLKLKGIKRQMKNKLVKYNLQLHAHNGSGFDTWIILNNLDCDKQIVNIIKNGKRIIESKVFKGFIQKKNRQTPHYLHFRCGMTHLNLSLKKLGNTFKSSKSLLKTAMNHDQIVENNWRDKKDEWLPYVKNDILCTVYSYARFCVSMVELTGFSKKGWLSLAALRFKNFNSSRTDKGKQYTLIMTKT